MKKVIMWAFIFTVLSGTTYGAFAAPTEYEAYAYTGEGKYAVVFPVQIREKLHMQWFNRTVTRTYSEVCTIDETTADNLKGRYVSAKGKDKNGMMYFKIKKGYESEVRDLITPSNGTCKVVKRPIWRWFMFVGGGSAHVS